MMASSRPAFVTTTSSATSWLRTSRSSFLPSCAILRRTTIQCPRSSRRTDVHMKAPTTPIVPSTTPVGEPNTLDFRLTFQTPSSDPLSPWHDLPLFPTSAPNVVTFVNEIPRGEQAKMEIATDERFNPIKQDIKKGALRFYKYGPSLVNYGAIPQTWEDPGSINPELNVAGDGDPIDVTEIGSEIMPFGAVYSVKVLGCLGLLDEGEIDWKVIAINVDDPLADQMNDIADVERLMPGRVAEVREWFRLYKTAEGKGENEYAFGGEAKDAKYTLDVIEETHKSWADLRAGTIANEDDLWIK